MEKIKKTTFKRESQNDGNEEKSSRKSRSKGKKSVENDTRGRRRSTTRSIVRDKMPKGRLVISSHNSEIGQTVRDDIKVVIFGKNGEVLGAEPPKDVSVFEACQELMEEFRLEAWNIIKERFTYREAPKMVSSELRDSWLRILEAEYLGEGSLHEGSASEHLVFKTDEAPLPLNFDFWSKGALEMFPKSRRDSVLDPFIRDFLQGKPLIPNYGGGDHVETMEMKSVSKTKTKSKSVHIQQEPNLHKKHSLHSLEGGDGVRNIASETAFSQKTKKGSAVHTPSSAATSSTSELDEIEFLQQAVSIKSSQSLHQVGIKPWTVSQCGARDGTNGVFRLFNQTTAEALAKAVDQTDNQPNQLQEIKKPSESYEPEINTMLEIINLDDDETDTIYESTQTNEKVGIFESVLNSKVPSELKVAKGAHADGSMTELEYADYVRKIKDGLSKGRKSMNERQGKPHSNIDSNQAGAEIMELLQNSKKSFNKSKPMMNFSKKPEVKGKLAVLNKRKQIVENQRAAIRKRFAEKPV